MNTLYLDTASATGAWFWKLGDTAPSQPHLVRIAALLWSDDADHPIDRYCALIRALPGWPAIGPEAHNIHGVYDHDLHTHGLALGAVMARVHRMVDAAGLIVAQNVVFHAKMLGRAYRDAEMGEPPPRDTFCVMQNARNVVRAGTPMAGRWKPPRISESYRHFAGEALSLSSDPIERGNEMADAVRLIHRGLMAGRGAA